jgi:hypothetical protein
MKINNNNNNNNKMELCSVNRNGGRKAIFWAIIQEYPIQGQCRGRLNQLEIHALSFRSFFPLFLMLIRSNYDVFHVHVVRFELLHHFADDVQPTQPHPNFNNLYHKDGTIRFLKNVGNCFEGYCVVTQKITTSYYFFNLYNSAVLIPHNM